MIEHIFYYQFYYWQTQFRLLFFTLSHTAYRLCIRNGAACQRLLSACGA